MFSEWCTFRIFQMLPEQVKSKLLSSLKDDNIFQRQVKLRDWVVNAFRAHRHFCSLLNCRKMYFVSYQSHISLLAGCATVTHILV